MTRLYDFTGRDVFYYGGEETQICSCCGAIFKTSIPKGKVPTIKDVPRGICVYGDTIFEEGIHKYGAKNLGIYVNHVKTKNGDLTVLAVSKC